MRQMSTVFNPLMKIFKMSMLAILIFTVPAFSSYQEMNYFSKSEALEKFFPNASILETKHRLSSIQKDAIEMQLGYEILEEDLVLIQAESSDGDLAGYAIILNELGKHYPITFITKVSPDYKVDDVLVMVYREPFGSEVRKKRFLKQFFKKSSQDPLQVDRDIDGITGATYSTAAISCGVKKALLFVENLTQQLTASHSSTKPATVL